MGYPLIIRYRVGLKPSPCKRLPVRGIRPGPVALALMALFDVMLR